MGSDSGRPEEKPVHSVRITRAYLVARYAVTFLDYDLFCSDTGHRRADSAGRSRGSQPVINVTWYDAIAYSNWLSERHGLVPCYGGSGKLTEWDSSCNGYRLPTEAEWEYAARGGSQSLGNVYAGSNDPSAVAWYDANSGDQLHPVGQKLPNELGLYDMSGNAYEWCSDWYGKSAYTASPQTNPSGPADGGKRVLRGGSYHGEPAIPYRTAVAGDLRVAFRYLYAPDTQRYFIGFRVAGAASP